MHFAVFDVDHTITRRSTGTRLLFHGRRAGLFPARMLVSLPLHYYRYRRGSFRVESVADRINGLAGRTRDELRAIAESCFNEKVRGDIMPGAVELIERHRAAGDVIVLATSSLKLIVRQLASHLGIDHLLCTELEFTDGVATGRFASAPCFGPEKLRRVTEFIEAQGTGLEDITFYSDSRLDLPLLHAAGRAVAVNPDPGLRRVARENGWDIVAVS